MLILEKFTLGVGDRFAHQAAAQLRACMMAADLGVTVIPVWNKSNREHGIVSSEPPSVRAAADAAVRRLGWGLPYHVDADHINLSTVDRFISSSDFYTLDVAAAIGQPAALADVETFLSQHEELIGTVRIQGIDEPFATTRDSIRAVAAKYLLAVQQAGAIYRHIVNRRGASTFVTEVSMDETDAPQTPPELLVILAAIADNGIPIQTIAPKFTGRFNKGVDYVGDVAQFEKEFGDDLAVIAFAASQYGLPRVPKLSVHSGSDKFSIYPSIRRALQKSGAGVHLKTAGTTWLEELIGMAESGGVGLALAKEVYANAFADREALCGPYAAVIDIRPEKLPAPEDVEGWTAGQYTSALRHDPANPGFNPDLRQLLHVGFKVAAKMGTRYLEMLDRCEASISRNVTENLFDRHIRPLFLE
ncbi:MAG TPA: tagaturonate epimerase family protein [Candidatus Acidoferrales bacterium]|nr:tagaturonate epimerase family protein [Candidatus Acidoferrales bacterium]